MDTVTEVMSHAIVTEPSKNEAGVPLPRECERKFVVPADSAARFLERIESRTALELADPARPVSYNRTTYLDTPDRFFFRSSRNAVARKLRIREYATARVTGAPPAFSSDIYFEVKESGEGFRSKIRIPFSSPIAEILSREPFRDVLGARPIVPVLTTFYRRVRRTCLDVPVSVTVDTDVRFSPPVDPGCALICSHPLFFLRHSIIELKTTGALPAWLLDELDPSDEAATFSKFEHGMRLLGGEP